MKEERKQTVNSAGNQQDDQDIESLVDAQSKGEQPKGVETEQQTSQAQTSEVDKRDSKGRSQP